MNQNTSNSHPQTYRTCAICGYELVGTVAATRYHADCWIKAIDDEPDVVVTEDYKLWGRSIYE